MIAYQRVDYNTGLETLGASPTRIWLIDLTTVPATTRPLFSDSQILGYAPQWSADGTRLALFDNNSLGVLVHDFTDNTTALIPTRAGGGDVSLSPDGTRVVFPRLIIEGSEARSNLQIADLASGEITDLTSPDERQDDTQSAWNPDGVRLALARRYLDERYTRTRQLYLLDTVTGDLTPLLEDPRYFNGFFSWNPPGTSLVIQRFPELTEDGQVNNHGRPEVWTYNVDTGALVRVAENAYLPRWVP
jgi:Tol biopolymer transport system component